MAFEALLTELETRREAALAMGGSVKLEARRAEGLLDARARITHLLDPDSFIESGLLATAEAKKVRPRAPADGKVAGYGKIAGRPVGIVSNDFTVMGASTPRSIPRRWATSRRRRKSAASR